jgi:hypothetical protein
MQISSAWYTCKLILYVVLAAKASRPDHHDRFASDSLTTRIEVSKHHFGFHAGGNNTSAVQDHGYGDHSEFEPRKMFALMQEELEADDMYSNSSEIGCADIYVQCRSPDRTGKGRRLTIARAQTVGQVAKVLGKGVVYVGFFAFTILTALAVAEARQDAFDGGGMSPMNFNLVMTHGLFGPIDMAPPPSFDESAAVCSNVQVKNYVDKKYEYLETILEEARKLKPPDKDWPASQDQWAASACRYLELNLEYLGKGLEAFLSLCVQHSDLCGSAGLCAWEQSSEDNLKMTKWGRKCPESPIIDVYPSVLNAGDPLLIKSFGTRISGELFHPAGEGHANGVVKICWSESDKDGTQPRSCSEEHTHDGLVVSIQDYQLGDQCAMALESHTKLQGHFDTLLSPRGVTMLPSTYKVHKVILEALPESGWPGGCSWGSPKGCAKGKVKCGIAKDAKKCGTFSKDAQYLCCPSVTRDEFMAKAVKHIKELDPPDEITPLANGDVVLAFAQGGMKKGACLRDRKGDNHGMQLAQNWMYGSTELTIWFGRQGPE